MAARAAVGFRAHSGWAAAVALGGPAEAPVVLARRRIEMVDRGMKGAAQPYHAAVGLEIGAAERAIAKCAARAATLAGVALRGMIEELAGHEMTACGLLLAAGRPLPALAAILASHALIHTAEGELFRDALRTASRACGLPLTEVKERDLLTRAPARLQQQVAQMGRTLGPPWRQDEKFAAMAAWLALHL